MECGSARRCSLQRTIQHAPERRTRNEALPGQKKREDSKLSRRDSTVQQSESWQIQVDGAVDAFRIEG